MLNIHNLHINHVNLLNIIIFLKNSIYNKRRIFPIHSPSILFSYTASLSKNINVTHFSIIYPKIKLESRYINITPTMISNHIEEFEEIQGKRKTENNT